MLMAEYFPREEMQKLESELWNLTMRGSDIEAYTTRFNDLATLCPHLVTPDSLKVERYIWGLPSPIQGNVQASEPAMFDSDKRLAHRLVTHALRQGTRTATTDQLKTADRNRKLRDWEEDQSDQEQTEEQPMLAICATITPATPITQIPANTYSGNLPKCNRCPYHHHGPCRKLHCNNCNRKGHTARYCRASTHQTTQATNAGASQTCYGCSKTGHFRRNCPKTDDTNARNTGGVLAICAAEDVQDPQ